MKPAKEGKIEILTRRINIKRQPNIPSSIGNRLNAQSDQPVKKATIVPTLAPERISPAAIGMLT
ncbi:MAG: hypothetical protein P9M07_06440 [Candidatus Aceula meridiana]|nr:hypothetical protein [Candidatus Aceula meridiana]